MPANAIVLETGIGAGVICEIRSAMIPMILPHINEPGMIILWADVFKMVLAMWGATMPTKPIGPQNAVTVPVIRQQLSKAEMRILSGLAPVSFANSSPKRMMSSPVLLVNAMMNAISRVADIIMISFRDVVPKLPADQLWNILRFSALLPDWRTVTTAFVMKLSMTPNTSKVEALLNFTEADMMITEAAAAPSVADTATDAPWRIPPDNTALPPARVAMAAPREAPELMPMM